MIVADSCIHVICTHVLLELRTSVCHAGAIHSSQEEASSKMANEVHDSKFCDVMIIVVIGSKLPQLHVRTDTIASGAVNCQTANEILDKKRS